MEIQIQNSEEITHQGRANWYHKNTIIHIHLIDNPFETSSKNLEENDYR